jgi:DNA invertase Pin-like site-specific DNA recombinase
MIYGYARVSTSDQKTDLQILALQEAGCESIFVETASGADRRRPELTKCLAKLQSGDTLVVWKLDRLGRSLSHLVAILDDLTSRGVQFRAITQGIETGTSTGRLVSHILGALAEFERELIKERTREGIKAAKGRGQKMGRRYVMNQEQIRHARRLMDEGNSASYVAGIFKVSRATLFNSFQRLKEDDLPGRKEEGRDARTVDMFDGKTDKERD